MKRKLNIRKTITALLLIYFVFTFVSQEFTIHRIKEQAKIQRMELDRAKKENVKLADKAELLRNNPDAYVERLARDMQYVKEGETIIVDEESKK
jgi:cell division protein FtsB